MESLTSAELRRRQPIVPLAELALPRPRTERHPSSSKYEDRDVPRLLRSYLVCYGHRHSPGHALFEVCVNVASHIQLIRRVMPTLLTKYYPCFVHDSGERQTFALVTHVIRRHWASAVPAAVPGPVRVYAEWLSSPDNDNVVNPLPLEDLPADVSVMLVDKVAVHWAARYFGVDLDDAPQKLVDIARRHERVGSYRMSELVLSKKFMIQQTIRKDQCRGCGNSFEKLSVCKTCRSTRYCSKECQSKDWPTHKKECSSLQGAIVGVTDFFTFEATFLGMHGVPGPVPIRATP